MEKALKLPIIKSKSGTVLFDIMILASIYFLPAISHLLALPLYYLDPMRIALVFVLLHTSQRNTFIIALTLPLFSFLISAHPSLIKSGLITTELLLNVFLFFILFRKTDSRVTALFISIILSKTVYYFLKYVTIESGILSDNLFSTPFYFQNITLLLISLYVLIFEFIAGKPKGNTKD